MMNLIITQAVSLQVIHQVRAFLLNIEVHQMITQYTPRIALLETDV